MVLWMFWYMCVLYCFVPFGKTVLLYCYANKSLESWILNLVISQWTLWIYWSFDHRNPIWNQYLKTFWKKSMCYARRWPGNVPSYSKICTCLITMKAMLTNALIFYLYIYMYYENAFPYITTRFRIYFASRIVSMTKRRTMYFHLYTIIYSIIP